METVMACFKGLSQRLSRGIQVNHMCGVQESVEPRISCMRSSSVIHWIIIYGVRELVSRLFFFLILMRKHRDMFLQTVS